MNEPLSVVVVPNKLRYINFIQKYLHQKTVLIQYRYDIGYNGILETMSQILAGRKVTNLAMVLYSTPFGVYFCSNDGHVEKFSHECLLSVASQSNFFTDLKSFFETDRRYKCRLDFLNCNLSCSTEIRNILTMLAQFVGIPCCISKDLWGNDISVEEFGEEKRPASEYYFSNLNQNAFTPQQTMVNFEKIRAVGKGAFGTAVLYRKKDDESLVILKEINMHDLSAPERQMAMNEVKVLSLLDHPNIVAYYDSFEEDGILIIEMEYADNGNLCQFLSKKETPLLEKQILELFQQIVSAIHYIHEHKILHRDLKTANIFLTKEDIIKVGDFGISKILTTTLSGANSVLGTPQYISPEMCQGKLYNEKSDVWSLGCILYEMACLRKTFEGSNLPAIVNKIVKGQFEPIRGNYSDELKELVMAMLNTNPDDRSSTDIILYHKLPMMLKKFETKNKDESGLAIRNSRSVLYVMDIGTLSLTPVALPSHIRIKQVCSSRTHVVVLTTERIVYTWGDNKYGQLGHGDLQDRTKPDAVSSLRQKSLIRVSCGSAFSIFGSENGIIMTCGQGQNGCLGHGDLKDVWKPKLIESLLSADIICISTAFDHVVAVTSESIVFGWGSNRSGQLGIDSNAVYSTPQEINIPGSVPIRNAFTSKDATMLLTDAGAVFASGSNYGNKLGLNVRLGFLMTMKSVSQQPGIGGVSQFVSVRTLSRHRVNQISMGSFHTVVICQSGKVISFGVNSEGQLGNSHVKCVPMTSEVKGIRKHIVTKIATGTDFSVAYVDYNSLYFWGKRQMSKCNSPTSKLPKSADRNRMSTYQSLEGYPYGDNVDGSTDGSYTNLPSEEDEKYKVYSIPVLILHLKNSRTEDADKELICLTDCVTYGDCDLLVQIETTAPPPKRRKKRSRTVNDLKKMDCSSLKTSGTIDSTACIPSTESLGTDKIPTWIRNEFIGAKAQEDVTISSNKSHDPLTIQPSHPYVKSKSTVISPSNNFLRIYSSSDQNCNGSDITRSLSNSSETMCPPVHLSREFPLRRHKSEMDFATNSKLSKEKELKEQLNSLQTQLQTHQHLIAKSTVLISKIQNEIDRLSMERDGGEIGSTVCTVQ